MLIEPLDVTRASDAEMAAYHDLATANDVEAVPDDERQPEADWVAWTRIGPAARRTFSWVVWDDDRTRLLASSFLLFWEEEANRNLASFWVNVRPEFRRQGLGRRLLAPLADVARDHGRTLLDAAARPGIPAGAAFLESLGGEHRFTARVNALDIDRVDLDLLHRWVDMAKERASDYRLDGWDGATPDERIDAYTGALGIMNTAPREGFDAEDDVFTADLVRDSEAAAIARGLDPWILAAVHEPTGEIAGITDVAFTRHWPTRAFQGNTGVDPTHRNKGLGRWLKAAMLLRLIDERPMVRRITTQNAGSNEPMLNINYQLGFRCIEERLVYQVPLDVLASRVAA